MPMTTVGRNLLPLMITGGSYTAFSTSNGRLGVGDSTTAFAVAQTDLQASSNKLRKALDGAPNIATNVITYVSTFGSSDANFSWQEFGLFNAGSGGDMFSRVVSNQGTKVSGQVWELTYQLTVVNGAG
jgi:hypothetical protein